MEPRLAQATSVSKFHTVPPWSLSGQWRRPSSHRGLPVHLCCCPPPPVGYWHPLLCLYPPPGSLHTPHTHPYPHSTEPSCHTPRSAQVSSPWSLLETSTTAFEFSLSCQLWQHRHQAWSPLKGGLFSSKILIYCLWWVFVISEVWDQPNYELFEDAGRSLLMNPPKNSAPYPERCFRHLCGIKCKAKSYHTFPLVADVPLWQMDSIVHYNSIFKTKQKLWVNFNLPSYLSSLTVDVETKKETLEGKAKKKEVRRFLREIQQNRPHSDPAESECCLLGCVIKVPSLISDVICA